MNVLLTGGAGYIGSHVVRALSAAGHTPVVYDNLVNGHRQAVGGAEFVAGDVASKSDLLGVLDDFSPERAEACLRDLASSAPLYEVSSKNGAGLDAWLQWLGTARSEAA